MRQQDLFERLDPPPHGLTRLRARLEARGPRRVLLYAVAFGVLAGIVAAWIARPRTPDLVARAHGRASLDDVGLGFARAPTGPVVDGEGTALAEVKTTDPRVVFVWVASTE